MIAIKIANTERVKSYLQGFQKFEFDNLIHLLFELFHNTKISTDQVDHIVYEHILSLGYEHVGQIPEKTKKELEKWYFKMLDKYQKDFDEEQEIYCLMAKVVAGDILVTIDDDLINNQKITLKRDSVISFTSLDKINDIQFTTI